MRSNHHELIASGINYGFELLQLFLGPGKHPSSIPASIRACPLSYTNGGENFLHGIIASGGNIKALVPKLTQQAVFTIFFLLFKIGAKLIDSIILLFQFHYIIIVSFFAYSFSSFALTRLLFKDVISFSFSSKAF